MYVWQVVGDMIYEKMLVGFVYSNKDKAVEGAMKLAKESAGISKIVVDYDDYDDEVTMRDEYNYCFYIRVFRTKLL